jgi:quinoprotein glucose dehydrogenase
LRHVCGSDVIRYSALNQINKKNVKDLKVAALDAATGKLLWKFDPVNSVGRGRALTRGVSYWTDEKSSRIFTVYQQWLYALDAKTGKAALEFGDNGRIQLRLGLGRPDTLSVSLSTPGVVYKDILMCGSIVAEDLPAAPGDIRAFDVRTGKSRWSFHTIPHPGELGYETWPPEAWKTSGGVNDWGGLALDAKRGMVFVPTGSPSFDFYARDLRGESSGVYRCSCRRRQRISFGREIRCVRAAKLVCS